jgi:hypothetical protein
MTNQFMTNPKIHRHPSAFFWVNFGLESDVPPDTALMRYQAYSEAFLRPNLPWPESLNIAFTNRCHLILGTPHLIAVRIK